MGQDLSTGELKALDPFLEKLIEEEKERSYPERLQAAMDRAIPERANQGPVLATGEEVTVIDSRGVAGRFRVHAISGNRLYLDSVPSKR